jgi:integrase
MRGTLRRKSADTWQLRVFRGCDDSGKQLCDYHTIHAKTKREAETEQRRILHALDTGGYTEPSRLTVAEYLESWLQDHAANNVTPYTFDRYESIVRKHLIPALGSIRLNQLTAIRIQRYYTVALESGRLERKCKQALDDAADGQDERKPRKDLDPQTVLKHHRVLRTALKRAVRLGIIVANPCDRVDPPKTARTEMKALDEMETERLLMAARERQPLSLFAAVLLAANAGLRRGEVLGLRWSDVDFDACAVHVRRTLQRSKSEVVFGEPKTSHSRRMLAMDPDTMAELKSYRARQNQSRLALGDGWHDNDLVCPGRCGEPWHPNMLSRDFKKLATAAGLPVRLHDLRHTHASQLIRTGAPAKVIQERLGHSSAAFTLTTYGHLLPGMQDEAVARLAEARAAARQKLADSAASA